MKILIVSEDVPYINIGGLGKHAITLANALVEAGHQVDFMGSADYPYEFSAHDINLKAQFIPGITLRHTNWKERQLGFFNPFKRPFIARRIARAILRIADNYDVIHYHGHLPMIGTMIPDHINFAQTRHDQGSDCLTHTRFRNGEICTESDPSACAACIHPHPGPLRRWLSALAVRRYRQLTEAAFVRHKTIFVSEKLRSNYARFAPRDAQRREFVVHNFIDYSRLRAITHGKPKEAEDGISVLVAARLDVTKGVGAFLSELADKMPPNMIVTIAGDGPDHDSLRAKFKSDVVRFLGWQPYDEVIMRLCASDIAVVPSLCEESCGTTVIEALSVGKRVLALARGGTPELKCYERYPGQLEVYPDMTTLVQGLARPVPNIHCDNFDDFAADVHHIVDQILAVYRA